MKTRSKFKTVDEYLSALPKFERGTLEELRKIIKQVTPQAEEIISYNIPAFKLNGILVWYAAYENHIGLYPTSSPIKIFKDELTGYK
ncbi:MAG: iron chaperone, partial [Ginsengibacter sp.]